MNKLHKKNIDLLISEAKSTLENNIYDFSICRKLVDYLCEVDKDFKNEDATYLISECISEHENAIKVQKEAHEAVRESASIMIRELDTVRYWLIVKGKCP